MFSIQLIVGVRPFMDKQAVLLNHMLEQGVSSDTVVLSPWVSSFLPSGTNPNEDPSKFWQPAHLHPSTGALA